MRSVALQPLRTGAGVVGVGRESSHALEGTAQATNTLSEQRERRWNRQAPMTGAIFCLLTSRSLPSSNLPPRRRHRTPTDSPCSLIIGRGSRHHPLTPSAWKSTSTDSPPYSYSAPHRSPAATSSRSSTPAVPWSFQYDPKPPQHVAPSSHGRRRRSSPLAAPLRPRRSRHPIDRQSSTPSSVWRRRLDVRGMGDVVASPG